MDAEFRLIRVGVRGPLEADEPLMLPMVPMCTRTKQIKGLPISVLYVNDRVVGVHVHERYSGQRPR